MKKFIETIKNIWSIEDLRNRILTTLLLVLIYRVGSYIALPGIDANALANFEKSSNQGILGLVNMFAGGSFSRASIFALGIMPYISASIAIQLLTIAVPSFQKMQKEGESGRKKINQYTRYLTVIVTGLQASAYVAYLRNNSGNAIIPEYGTFFFWLSTTVILTAGTLFVMWLGEKITDKGIGNGTSIIIMMGILARLPQALVQEFSSKVAGEGGGPILFLVEIAIFILITIGLILLVQGTRKIPVNYAKRIVGNKQYGGVRQFIPLKVNAAGVMPIIFAQAIMFIPATVVGFATNSESASGFIRIFSDHTNGWYNLIFGLLVIIFTYFYTALIFNPTQMADEMKRNNGFIPGVKPGKATADYIGAVMDRITLPGAFFLALVGVLPGVAAAFKVNSNFATFFGGTSLLIMVGVILDTLQQIESQLLMRHYDGLMSTGRIKGRTAPANV
ncbi:protein translocase subunit secY/sec61 alpha [Chitinophaga terrae (ex Kim and Jung 2007)]|uniref:Protein translocase subunit SecY n=1 Tax=Chitinophaga terrae (ex Kim and Jung 2007) TaxID=408074 RepID=A0A1H4A8U7_9BACT|nr:preprotein translocase subunit SecY [Chitinophaga terrae (ex Kim and Jung 2007)]MDQ0105957.1 preprotein translocase subunit SecY [Chitinophaga terrae (ex Kim and Jung 2007)]GEP90113.1 protein translocase subunit SecY [Chitinophaga terrae (ex Kim and Jung 2007)]SEA32415.1 protein translocase subunit secY/sec61 alpha [Chitinophaga terrae (ex Kim and Jung 2007)]